MSAVILNDPFWLSDPTILFRKLDIIPNRQMTNAERLNALTRLLLIITLGMFILGYDQYLTVLILGLLLIIILRSTQKENFSAHRGNHDPCHTCGFDSTMPYINTKYETSPQQQYTHLNDGLRSYTHAHYKVIPVDTPAPYREVWRKEKRWCKEFSQYPNTYNIIPNVTGSPQAYRYISDNFSQPENKCNYADRAWIDNTTSGQCPQRKQSVMPAIQSAFMRDSMEYRNNIMGEYIDQFERERNHNCTNFKPGRKTF